jgi:hypothetical protein
MYNRKKTLVAKDKCKCGDSKMVSSEFCSKCSNLASKDAASSRYICECGRPKWKDAEKCHICKKEKETNYHRYYWSSHDLCACGKPKGKESPRCRECHWAEKKKERDAKERFCFVCKVALTDKNWYPSNKRAGHFVCNKCHAASATVREKSRRKLGMSLKDEVMQAYGGMCKCCGESHLAFLTIDHIHNDGATHRKTISPSALYKWLKKEGFPQDDFQCLCFNCNFAKSRNPGGCPHEIERQQRAEKVASALEGAGGTNKSW